MHEYHLAEDILRTIDEAASKAGAESVRKVRLTVGKLRNVPPETLSFILAEKSKEGRADGAEFEIVEEDILFKCPVCGKREAVDEYIAGYAPACCNRPMKAVEGDAVTVEILDPAP